MEAVEGARTFAGSGEDYDAFMGRYSRPLSALFADFAGVATGQGVLDVGCGPGALTAELARRLGTGNVSACDPSPPFVQACAARHPGVEVRLGSAEQLPFEDGAFDAVLSQLVLHFISNPTRAAAEFRRVVRPGGTIAACVWDFEVGMEMMAAFWESAASIDPDAPQEGQVMRFGRLGEIAGWLADARLADVTETTLTVSSEYRDFDELWNGFCAGIGPVGNYCVSLPPDRSDALHEVLHERLGSPAGGFSLRAVARAAKAVRP